MYYLHYKAHVEWAGGTDPSKNGSQKKKAKENKWLFLWDTFSFPISEVIKQSDMKEESEDALREMPEGELD